MSDEWILNVVFLLGTAAYVYILYRGAKLAKYVFVSRRWNYRKRPPRPNKEPSPHWKWAPWIVAVAAVSLFAGFLMIGSPVVEAIALAGLFLIFGVKGLALLYYISRDDGFPPET